MKLILGNTTQLKEFLLAGSMQNSENFDAQVNAVGLAVAGLFESYCARAFGYEEDMVEQVSADKSTYVLKRYPLQTLTKVELSTVMDEWTELTGAVQNANKAAGILFMMAQQGTYRDQLRFTYTGGFWVPDDGEEDEDWEDIPDGATRVHVGLHEAWLLQCQDLWTVRDNLGQAIAGIIATGGNVQPSLTLVGYDLVDGVKATLQGYRRFSI